MENFTLKKIQIFLFHFLFVSHSACSLVDWSPYESFASDSSLMWLFHFFLLSDNLFIHYKLHFFLMSPLLFRTVKVFSVILLNPLTSGMKERLKWVLQNSSSWTVLECIWSKLLCWSTGYSQRWNQRGELLQAKNMEISVDVQEVEV